MTNAKYSEIQGSIRIRRKRSKLCTESIPWAMSLVFLGCPPYLGKLVSEKWIITKLPPPTPSQNKFMISISCHLSGNNLGKASYADRDINSFLYVTDARVQTLNIKVIAELPFRILHGSF
jgi:hypothetical protein